MCRSCPNINILEIVNPKTIRHLVTGEELNEGKIQIPRYLIIILTCTTLFGRITQ